MIEGISGSNGCVQRMTKAKLLAVRWNEGLYPCYYFFSGITEE
jgi:hypothetical protein